MNQWPNVKLRVIEGWDEDYRHSMNSLHYEGRAVDITTSDKDKSKYGMLARLAVEAGFDWVHYESRSHVHCSVRSERADDVRNNGCFDAKSFVETPTGRMEMSQLQTNDLVLTMNSLGELHFSPVLMWLDRDEQILETFVELQTKSNKTIRLTTSHLIYVSDYENYHQFLLDTCQTELLKDAQQTGQQKTDLNVNKEKTLQKQAVSKDTGGNNYYHYDVAGHELSASGVRLKRSSVTSTRSLDVALLDDQSTTSESENESLTSDSVLGFESIVSDVDKKENNIEEQERQQQQREIADCAYTMYARNALVGQYLLILMPEDERLEYRARNEARQNLENGISSVRSPGVNRLTFTNRQYDKLVSQDDSASKQEIYFAKKKSALKSKQTRGRGQLKQRVKFDQIVSVNFVSRQGIYAPLTREGNILVNSVVASCYAVISDHYLAHLSMAPVRLLSWINELLFGLRPETPAYERTIEFVKRRELYESSRQELATVEFRGTKIRTLDNLENDGRQETPNYQTTNSLNRTTTTTTTQTRHIHWYPILLYNIARFVLPAAYLY